MLRKTAYILALSVSMAGVAHAGLFSDDEAHRKIDALQKDSNQKMQAVEDRLAKLEAKLNSQGLVDLLNQVEALKADLNKLRGQMEVQMHELETTQKRQKDLYADLDARLRNLERPGAANVAATAAVAPPATANPVAGKGGNAAAPAAASAPAVPADAAAESRVYDAALNQFKVGNYSAAIAGFQNFLKTYPGSGLAPSAQYWIGNSYFAQREFKAALEAQRKLIASYPNSQKVPDALLNVASCQAELGEHNAARKTLEELVAKYPVSDAAERAQKRLANSKN